MASNKDQNSNKKDSANEMPPPDVQSVVSKYETMFEEMMIKFEQQQAEVNTIRDQLEKGLSVILNKFTVLELASASLNGKVDALDDCLATAISEFQDLDQKFDLISRELHESEDALNTITSKVENLEDEVTEIDGQLDAVKDDLARIAETEAADDLEKDVHGRRD